MPKFSPKDIDGRCVRIMAAIDEFASQKVKRSGFQAIGVQLSRSRKDKREYRSRLRSAVERFEVCIVLNLRSLSRGH